MIKSGTAPVILLWITPALATDELNQGSVYQDHGKTICVGRVISGSAIFASKEKNTSNGASPIAPSMTKWPGPFGLVKVCHTAPHPKLVKDVPRVRYAKSLSISIETRVTSRKSTMYSGVPIRMSIKAYCNVSMSEKEHNDHRMHPRV